MRWTSLSDFLFQGRRSCLYLSVFQLVNAELFPRGPEVKGPIRISSALPEVILHLDIVFNLRTLHSPPLYNQQNHLIYIDEVVLSSFNLQNSDEGFRFTL